LTNSLNVGRVASSDVENRDSTPATPVESIHTIPPSEPPKRQDDEKSDPFDVDFDESPVISVIREDEPRRPDSISEDEAEADEYFKKYVTAPFILTT
jgi:hypothetical protein